MSKYYTGVGSRNTPKNILSIMRLVSKKLASLGYILRSGGAPGADSAFESGAGDLKNIYYAKDSTLRAENIARKYHPAWNRCSNFARKLHARNAFQVLGDDLKSPSSFLICWTPDGCKSHASRSISTGGTGTAISIADAYGVKIFNLANASDRERVLKFIDKFSLQCKCGWIGTPNLEESGPHTKALCPECGAYIKFVSASELYQITGV